MSVVFSLIYIGFSWLVNCENNLPSILMIVQKIIIYSVANGRIFEGGVYIPIGMLLAKKKIPQYLNYMLFLCCFECNIILTNSIISSYLLIITAVAFLEL